MLWYMLGAFVIGVLCGMMFGDKWLRLSRREQQVMDLIRQGQGNVETRWEAVRASET